MWEGINEGKRRCQWKNLPKLRTPLGVMHSSHLSWNAVGGFQRALVRRPLKMLLILVPEMYSN